MINTKLFLFGLDKAGKTSISKYIKTNECETTRPTLAFNIDKWAIDGLEIQVWDAPGQIAFRSIWKKGFHKAHIIMFILDTANEERFLEAKQEFDKVLNDLETRNLPLIFCFHKIDLDASNSLKNKARELFKLPLIMDREVFIFDTSIHECGEVSDLKSKIVELIQKSRW